MGQVGPFCPQGKKLTITQELNMYIVYRCVSDCRSRGPEFDPSPVSNSFVEIDHEIISTVILLPSALSFKKGCCQLQAKVCAQITS